MYVVSENFLEYLSKGYCGSSVIVVDYEIHNFLVEFVSIDDYNRILY